MNDGAGLYDQAMIDKLSFWTKDTNITVTSPNETRELFKQIADRNNDKAISLPLITISRPNGYTILQPSKRPMSFDGLMVDATYEKAKELNAIPINLKYQLDVYTRYRDESDSLVRNLIFNIVNYPKLTVTIPYNSANYLHDSNMILNPDIRDNSDIPERLVPGQFTRVSIDIDLDDAYLWDIRYKDTLSISPEFVIDD